MARINRTSTDTAELDRRENRRFETARGAAGAGNMSDTKWHRVIQLLAAYKPVHLRIKLLGSTHVSVAHYFFAVNREYTEGSSGLIRHREIEWLEIRGSEAVSILEGLEELGKLPIIRLADGFRLQAYGPI